MAQEDTHNELHCLIKQGANSLQGQIRAFTSHGLQLGGSLSMYATASLLTMLLTCASQRIVLATLEMQCISLEMVGEHSYRGPDMLFHASNCSTHPATQ